MTTNANETLTYVEAQQVARAIAETYDTVSQANDDWGNDFSHANEWHGPDAVYAWTGGRYGHTHYVTVPFGPCDEDGEPADWADWPCFVVPLTVRGVTIDCPEQDAAIVARMDSARVARMGGCAYEGDWESWRHGLANFLLSER